MNIHECSSCCVFFSLLYVIYFCDCQITSEGDISLLVLQRSKFIQLYALEEELQPGTDISFTSFFFARESFIASLLPACCLGRNRTESPRRRGLAWTWKLRALVRMPYTWQGELSLEDWDKVVNFS